MRLWFRRKNKSTSTTTTVTAEENTMVESKLKIVVTVNNKAGIYQTARRAQVHLDDIDALTDGARLLSKKLAGVEINDQRAVVAVLEQASGSEKLAEELVDLFEEMAAGYGVAAKKPAKGKATQADPTDRLDAVVENAEQMKENVTLVLATALDAAFEGNRKQITTALGTTEIPEHLMKTLLPSTTQAKAIETQAEPEETEDEPTATVKLKPINHRPVKAETVNAV